MHFKIHVRECYYYDHGIRCNGYWCQNIGEKEKYIYETYIYWFSIFRVAGLWPFYFPAMQLLIESCLRTEISQIQGRIRFG